MAALVEIYQWLTREEAVAATSDEVITAAAADELADIALYLVRSADIADVDLTAAINDKLERNELRFPPRSWRCAGSAEDLAGLAHRR